MPTFKTKFVKREQILCFLLFQFSLLITLGVSAQNVGIGTTTPKARLHVLDSSVVFSGTEIVSLPAANPPVSGSGKRMMWYADKAAFRTGYVQNSEWDNNNVGPYSFAAGFNTKAVGSTSLALGYQTTALADYSTAFGNQTIAKGYSSTVIGMYNDSILLSDDVSPTATTPLFIVGNGNSLTERSNALTVLKNGNVGIGKTPANKLDVGYGTVRVEGPETSGGTALSVGGFGNVQIDAPGFPGGRLVVKENGNVGIGKIFGGPQARLHVADSAVLFSGTIFPPPATTSVNPPMQGQGIRMFWYPALGAFRAGYVDAKQWDRDSIGQLSVATGRNTKAKGAYSTAMGFSTNASGYFSTAMGQSTVASGSSSTAMGVGSIASGQTSTAMGESTIASGNDATAMGLYSAASGNYSTAMGFLTTASANYSTAMGYYTKARSTYSLVAGRYNDTTAVNSLFEIGNGTADYARSNALTVLNNADVGIGLASPKAKLHIVTGASGYSGSYFSGEIIEGNNNTYLNFLTPEDNESGVLFGKPSSAASGGIIYNNSSNLNGFQFRTNGNSAKMVIDQSGNVGIGTITPSAKLCVNGNVAYTGYIGACSDIRYKRDFIPITKPLASVLSLNGFYYYWKKDEFPQMQFNDERQLGFSAQEIERLFPEIVMTDANGYKSVDYGRLTPVLVEAIKEQHTLIHSQEQRINDMEKEIAKLKIILKKLLNQ